jgi:hypothetical protein
VNGLLRVRGEWEGGGVRKVVNFGRTLLSASRAENLVMRLSLAVPAFAGLLLGWAALAHADAPPAAPIFYCPTPGKSAPAPAATPAKPAGHAARVVHASERRHQGCPTLHVASEHRHWRGHEHGPKALASEDVSASQAFIYRYERALHGFDARAADEAWAEGRRPCPPHADHCPGAWRHDGPAMDQGPALAQREIPPPPCPHGCPGPEGWRHGDDHRFAESAPLPPVEARALPPLPEPAPPPRLAERTPPPPAPRPSVHAYAWQDGHSGYGYAERDEQAERAGGWSYSEQDGQGHYRQWGDHFAGDRDGRADSRHDDGGYDDGRYAEDRHDDGRGERHWAEAPRYRCPPPVPANSCSAGPDAPVRHSDVAVAGRDAAGYLTWPGKTE